jgi:Esterase/lipase
MGRFSEDFREKAGKGDAKRDAGLTTPDDIERFDNISYGTIEPKWQMLDVYRPKNREMKKLPVIMSIHGGGWVYGDKDVYQWYCMSLAQRGFAVVNYSYRLAPEYKYPASFEDTSTVAEWIMTHAEQYGFDTEHIFGVGDSAGAHMLSLFAAAITNPEYHADFTLPKGFSFQAIALNCGAYKMKYSEAEDNDMNPMKEFLPDGGTQKELRQISSADHITDQFPPSFVMTCPKDFLSAAPEDLIPVLKENCVPFIYRVYGNKQNPLGHVFHCNIKTSDAKLCNDEECNFFKEFC